MTEACKRQLCLEFETDVKQVLQLHMAGLESPLAIEPCFYVLYNTSIQKKVIKTWPQIDEPRQSI